MKKLCLISLVSVLLVALVGGLSLTSCGGPGEETLDEFEDQPDKIHSNITCYYNATANTTTPKDAKSIVDVDFAKELHDALDDNGFHSMVITFCQCFGGGMMDDVADKFAGSTKPISMTSGSTHNKTAVSVTGKNGFSAWGRAYQDAHPGKTGNTNNNPKESDAFNSAKNDPDFKDRINKRKAQFKTLNNGGDLKLGDGTGGSGATSYHAILFGGYTAGRNDYWNNIAGHHKMLTDSGYPAANIKTFYGDGIVPQGMANPDGIDPDPATRDNLIQAIRDLETPMNENEQLYIFITDHGSPDQSPKGTQPKTVLPEDNQSSSNTFAFSPPALYMVEALQSPYNTSGPYIELNVETSGNITSNWEVLFNDNAWAVNSGDNTFPGGGDEAALRFPIDPDAINSTGDNDIWLRNSQSTDDPIEVEIYFSMGDIETTIDEITIGAVRSLSGGLEMIGDYAFGPVLDYWVDEVNAAGGINVAGKDLPIVLDIQDDESEMATMVSLLSDMVDGPPHDFVFAPVSTAFLQTAAYICNANEYILMGAEGGCTSIMDTLDELPYLFGVLNFADHNQMEELFKLFDIWGVETVAEINSDDLDGLEYSSIAASEAAKYPNIDMVMSETVGPFPEDVEILLQQAEALNADVFCAFTYPSTTMVVVEQAIANDINFNALVLGPGSSSEIFRTVFGDDVVEGVIGLGAWNEDTSATAEAFAADMIAMHGREYMDWWGQLYYYAGLQCFQQAIERAGTLDQSVIRDILATEHFTTVLGDTWFEDANGNHPITEGGGLLAVECHPGQIGQWRSGIFEVIDIGPNRTAVPIYPKPNWPE